MVLAVPKACGLDFMSSDITCEQRADSYRIFEMNSLPGIGMHIAPGRGVSRNSAAIIADMIFPETCSVVGMRVAA